MRMTPFFWRFGAFFPLLNEIIPSPPQNARYFPNARNKNRHMDNKSARKGCSVAQPWARAPYENCDVVQLSTLWNPLISLGELESEYPGPAQEKSWYCKTEVYICNRNGCVTKNWKNRVEMTLNRAACLASWGHNQAESTNRVWNATQCLVFTKFEKLEQHWQNACNVAMDRNLVEGQKTKTKTKWRVVRDALRIWKQNTETRPHHAQYATIGLLVIFALALASRYFCFSKHTAHKMRERCANSEFGSS